MEKEKLFNELERMSEDSNGILSMCAFPDCKRIRVLSDNEEYWFLRDENPELYDKVLGNYKKRNSLKDLCISHGYCPICVSTKDYFKDFNSE